MTATSFMIFLFLTIATAMNSNEPKPYIKKNGNNLTCMNPNGSVYDTDTKIQWWVEKTTTEKNKYGYGPTSKTESGTQTYSAETPQKTSPNSKYHCKPEISKTWSEEYSTHTKEPDQRSRFHPNPPKTNRIKAPPQRYHSGQQNKRTAATNQMAELCTNSILNHKNGCLKFGYHGFKDVKTTSCIKFQANANGTDILEAIKTTITKCATHM